MKQLAFKYGGYWTITILLLYGSFFTHWAYTTLSNSDNFISISLTLKDNPALYSYAVQKATKSGFVFNSYQSNSSLFLDTKMLDNVQDNKAYFQNLIKKDTQIEVSILKSDTSRLTTSDGEMIEVFKLKHRGNLVYEYSSAGNDDGNKVRIFRLLAVVNFVVCLCVTIIALLKRKNYVQQRRLL